MSTLHAVLALVALQRLAELLLANRNTRRLLAAGGREAGRRHYPLFIVLHASWLAAIAAGTPRDAAADWPLLLVFAILQLGRIWVIASLGRFWTTRIITVPGRPLVRRGPYRWLKHPNYWIVTGEIAVLPLAFGNWPVAAAWSVLNAALLLHRVQVEERALSERMQQSNPDVDSAREPSAQT